MKRALIGFLVLTLLGCGGSQGGNRLEVDTVPSVSDVTLRFTQLPDGVTDIELSGLAEPPGEHDHAHARADDEHEDHEDEHVLVYGPVSQPIAPLLVFSEVPSNVIEVELDFLAGGEVVGHAHLDVSLQPGGNFILEDPLLEDDQGSRGS